MNSNGTVDLGLLKGWFGGSEADQNSLQLLVMVADVFGFDVSLRKAEGNPAARPGQLQSVKYREFPHSALKDLLLAI